MRLLVEHLPEIRGRSREVLGLFEWSQRKDLALVAVGHYEKVGPTGRKQILDYLTSNSSRPSSSSYLGDHPTVGRVIKRGLEDPISVVRLAAVNGAQYFFRADMVPGLIRALRDENPSIRYRAVQALHRAKDPRAIRPMLEILKDKERNVADLAAKALMDLADRKIVGDLLELLDEDADTPFPEEALSALQRFATVADIAAVGNKLSRMRPDIRINAIDLLGVLQSSAALPFFREQLKSRDLSAREAAIRAM